MERNNGMYFTVWYGVYHAPTRALRHSSGGHPPALLVDPLGRPKEVREPGIIIGLVPEAVYKTGIDVVEPGSRIFVYSDGAYEATKPDKSLLDFEEFKEFLTAEAGAPDLFGRLKKWILSIQGQGPLADDFTMMRVFFPKGN
jgi:sigma-B regulation protein RsbU (phosphoserine phosphatase)